MRVMKGLSPVVPMFVVSLGLPVSIWAGEDPAASAPATDEVQRLHQELEILKQDYAARLAELESRLKAIEGRPAPLQAATETPAPSPAPTGAAEAPAPPRGPETAQAAPPPEATKPEAAVPAGAAGAGGPTGALPLYGPQTSKVFNPDIAVDRRFPGRRREERYPGGARRPSSMHESEVVLPGDRRSLCAGRLLPHLRARRGGRRGRLHHLPDASRRRPHEGRQDEGRVRQGGRHAQPRAALDRSAAGDAKPDRGRGRALGLRASPSRA